MTLWLDCSSNYAIVPSPTPSGAIQDGQLGRANHEWYDVAKTARRCAPCFRKNVASKSTFNGARRK